MVIFRLVQLAKVGNPFPEGFVDPFGDGFFLIPIVFRSVPVGVSMTSTLAVIKRSVSLSQLGH